MAQAKIKVVAKARPEIIRIKLPPPPRSDKWVSVRAAALQANLSHVVVWKWAQRGIIPSRRAGRIVLVPSERVLQLAAIWHEHGSSGRWIFRSGDSHHAYIPHTRA